MTKYDVIEILADYYDLEMPEEDIDGEYDLGTGDWQRGGYLNNDRWLTLGDIVYALEQSGMLEEDD